MHIILSACNDAKIMQEIQLDVKCDFQEKYSESSKDIISDLHRRLKRVIREYFDNDEIYLSSQLTDEEYNSMKF